MKIISKTGIVSLIVAVALAVGGASVFAKGKKGGGKVCHGAKGTVTAADTSSISIATKKHGTKQFQLTASTVYEWQGKKGQLGTPATFTDVAQGERARITATGTQATKVVIKKAKHGKHKR